MFSVALKLVQPFPFIKGVRGFGKFFFRYIVLPFFLCVKIKTFSMIAVAIGLYNKTDKCFECVTSDLDVPVTQ